MINPPEKTCNRFGEFFEDDMTLRKSMNRLATFVSVFTIAVTLFFIAFMCVKATGTDLREYLGALTTTAIILAGLGGFNYGVGRAAGAYTQVRVAQAEQGIQPAPIVPPLGPTTTINVGDHAKPDAAKDVNIKAEGNVNVVPKRHKRTQQRIGD